MENLNENSEILKNSLESKSHIRPNKNNNNSPQFVQQSIYLDSENKNAETEFQNNLVKSIISANNGKFPIIDIINNNGEVNNFNPSTEISKIKSTLCKSCNQINFNQKKLDDKNSEYKELKQKIDIYKKREKKDEMDIKEMLFIYHHPYVSLFETEININELKNKIDKYYQDKMKINNTTTLERSSNDDNSILGSETNDSCSISDSEGDGHSIIDQITEDEMSIEMDE